MLRLNRGYFVVFIDSRIIPYPTSLSLNYLWSFGSTAGICLVIQIISGIFFAVLFFKAGLWPVDIYECTVTYINNFLSVISDWFNSIFINFVSFCDDGNPINEKNQGIDNNISSKTGIITFTTTALLWVSYFHWLPTVILVMQGFKLLSNKEEMKAMFEMADFKETKNFGSSLNRTESADATTSLARDVNTEGVMDLVLNISESSETSSIGSETNAIDVFAGTANDNVVVYNVYNDLHNYVWRFITYYFEAVTQADMHQIMAYLGNNLYNSFFFFQPSIALTSILLVGHLFQDLPFDKFIRQSIEMVIKFFQNLIQTLTFDIKFWPVYLPNGFNTVYVYTIYNGGSIICNSIVSESLSIASEYEHIFNAFMKSQNLSSQAYTLKWIQSPEGWFTFKDFLSENNINLGDCIDNTEKLTTILEGLNTKISSSTSLHDESTLKLIDVTDSLIEFYKTIPSDFLNNGNKLYGLPKSDWDGFWDKVFQAIVDGKIKFKNEALILPGANQKSLNVFFKYAWSLNLSKNTSELFFSLDQRGVTHIELEDINAFKLAERLDQLFLKRN